MLPYHCELHLGAPTVLTRYQADGPHHEYLGWELARGEAIVHVGSAVAAWDLRTYVTVDMIESGHLAASVARWRQRPLRRGDDRIDEKMCQPTSAAVLRDWLEVEVTTARKSPHGPMLTDIAHREAWNSALIVLVACDLVRDIRALRWTP